jgi:hypothetical protein
MTIESIDSLLFTLIVILPGFALIKASDHLLGKSPFRDNFDFTIWSGFLSLLIYFISEGLYNILALKKATFTSFVIIFVVSIILLAVYIHLIKHEIPKKIRYFLMNEYALEYNPNNSVWDAVLPGYSDYVIVYTSDGMKYGGTILLNTKGIGKDGTANKELFLDYPTRLDVNEDLEINEHNLKGLLLLEQDIKRIEFLGEIEEQKTVIIANPDK